MAIPWKKLDSLDQIGQIQQQSYQKPCLIYKHSHRCNICTIALYRLEDDWNFEPGEVEPYFLDVVLHRPVSQEVAKFFQVHHESPQVLLISNGECVYDASHLDIHFQELREEWQTAQA